MTREVSTTKAPWTTPKLASLDVDKTLGGLVLTFSESIFFTPTLNGTS